MTSLAGRTGAAPEPVVDVMVVPCFNEQHRLDVTIPQRFAGRPGLRLLFVNDGSLDATAAVLADLATDSVGEIVEVLDLPANVGKGEAVRRGMQLAIRSGCRTVGYFDADLSTPPEEILRLIATLDDHPDLEVALGSRIARLGSTIDRTLRRHLLGRVFATAASVALGCQVYDTQCGAKAFRVTPALVAALERPFRSAWAFDVELLSRLLNGGPSAPPVSINAMVEVPLDEWTEIAGSRLRPAAMAAALADVLWIAGWRQYRRLGRTRCPTLTN